MSLPGAAERVPIETLLRDLQGAIEDLLLTGLSAASEATRQALTVSFQAASRLRLHRLGVSLRVATEEVGRFARNEPGFSRRRYTFFVTRAWMLTRGMRHALAASDEGQWHKLAWVGASTPVDTLEVVSVGVARRVVPGAFAAFEFRLRTLAGEPCLWSIVFPRRPGASMPAEAYLHLPQPQGFKAAMFLPGHVLRLRAVQRGEDGRLTLGKDSTVEVVSDTFDAWDTVLHVDPAAALVRITAHRPGPFDLDVELQEEVVLRRFRVLPPERLEREQQLRFPLETPAGPFVVMTALGDEDGPLRAALASWTTEQAGPLFGVVHYESCRFVLQPLTLFGPEGPKAVMLDDTNFDAASLVKALDYT